MRLIIECARNRLSIPKYLRPRITSNIRKIFAVIIQMNPSINLKNFSSTE